MNLGSIKERQKEEYIPLIKDFIDQVKGLDVTGITEPHIPSIGEYYENCRYKIAFCGMETNGWGSLSNFVENEPYKIIQETNDTINDLEFLTWKKNDHATFWAFVLKFLSALYKLPYKELAEGKYPEVLKSFIWANTNSIERFEVSAKDNGADKGMWEKVKEASLPFDNLNHLINVAKPNIVFMLYKEAPEKFFLDMNNGYMGLNFQNKQTYFKQENSEYRYYYRRDSDTHIFCLSHPTWMGLHGKRIEYYVQRVINDINTYHVWNFMPEDLEKGLWFYPIEQMDKSSMAYKCEFIASLASFLIENKSVMSGKELQTLLNRNNIKTNSGEEYSENGGRGIYNLITQVWNYYYYNNDFQIAYNIARSFVKQNGEYAYE